MIKKLNSKLLPCAVRYTFSTNYDPKKDYYKILGLEKTASDAQLKSAYYKLAMKYHPDHNKGQEAKFKEINEAYSVLSDPNAKRDYEATRAQASSQGSSSYNNYNNYQSSRQDPYGGYQGYRQNNPYN